ncbi:hypothetical protein SDC9_190468 [bioreactor metagenome]|uniref:Uncharacterized protein n=1 Tax=bioreactor metagenome TaxID=1076179 RepID=A0A645HVM8_9ZZZZ
MDDRIQLPVRKIVDSRAGMDAAHACELFTKVKDILQERRFAEVHQVLQMNGAVKHTALFRTADQNAVPGNLQHKRTLFPGRFQGNALIFLRCDQQNSLRRFFEFGGSLDPEGDIHAPEQIILKIIRRMPHQFRGCGTDHDLPGGIDFKFPFGRFQRGIAAVCFMNFAHPFQKIIILFVLHEYSPLLSSDRLQ